MKQHLYKLTFLLLVGVALVVAYGPVYGQSNSDWFRRQQQQQQQRQQQQQQQQMRQQQQQQRQQMQQQMRQQMQQQMRQQMQQQQRQQMIHQQRLQNQQQQQRGMPRGSAIRTSPPGTLNYRPGFNGRATQDGRTLAIVKGRVLAVPTARAALASGQYTNGRTQTLRWTDSKRAAISAQVQKLANANLRERVRTGGPGGLAGKFNSAAGSGGGRSGGNRGRSGGNGRGGGNDNSGGGGNNGSNGPKKGDLTRKFNEAAGIKPKKTEDKPEPRPTPRPSTRPTPNGPRR